MALYIPPELLDMIFPNLLEWKQTSVDTSPQLDRQGVQTLANLCQSCRQFKTIAEPILYQSYSKRDSTIDESECVRRDLRLFLRTIINRPDLAARIKTLSLGHWGTRNRLSQVNMFSPPPADIARQFSDAAQHFPFKSLRNTNANWASCLSEGVEDADIALLIALLPNVETLKVSLPPGDGWFDVLYQFRFLISTKDQEMAYRPVDRSVSGRSKGNGFSYGLVTEKRVPRVLTKVKELSVMPSSYDMNASKGLPLRPLRELVLLPSLETLSMSFAFEKMSAESFHFENEDLSQIKHLKLDACCLSSVAICELVSQCASLHSFGLIWGIRRVDDESDDSPDQVEVTWSGLRKALEPSKKSLHSISMIIPDRRHMSDFFPMTEAVNNCGSFSSFSSLRNLRITEHGLLDNEGQAALLGLLPPSLEVLEVSEMEGRLLSCMDALGGQISQLQNLKVIRGAYSNKQSIDLWTVESGFSGPETEFHDCVWLAEGQDPFEQSEDRSEELSAWRKVEWVKRVQMVPAYLL